MKWSSRKPTRIDYSQIAIILIVAALVTLFVMLLTLMAPQQTSADDWVNLRTARRTAAVALPIDRVTTRASEPIAILICTVTAYSPTVAECDSDPMTTASGKRVYVGGVAADWSMLPCGSIVIIPGYNGGNPCTVIDTGGAIKGLKLDVFFWKSDEAVHWGRRKNVRVQVLYIPKVTP